MPVLRVAEEGVAAVALVEVVLPLHHHAEVLVVQDDDLGGNFLDVRRREFLHVHEERAVTVNVDDLLVRARHLGTERGGIAVAHGTQAGAGQELARELIFVILPGPHLMLAHAGGDDGVALGQLVEHLNRHLRENDFALLALEMILHVLRLHHLGGDFVVQRRA